MIRRHYITVLLLFVSILTLAVPVMPHHHHADGNICLRHRPHTRLIPTAATTKVAWPHITFSACPSCGNTYRPTRRNA